MTDFNKAERDGGYKEFTKSGMKKQLVKHMLKQLKPAQLKEVMERELIVNENLKKNPQAFYHKLKPLAKDQEKWFRRQLEIAVSLDLPMIFHERDSNGRFLEMLKKHTVKKIKGVVHCFSGDLDELEHYLDLGLYIGITGIITIKDRGARLRGLAANIPPDRLLVETDAPYLIPTPQKNHCRRNEPAFVKSVLLKLAEVRKEEPDQLADTIWQNTCRLYGLEA